MASYTPNASASQELPQAALDRIAELRRLFIERSDANLLQIRKLLELREVSGGSREKDGELIKLAHSLAGASALFGFPAQGEAAFNAETLLRSPGYSEAEFARVFRDLIGRLSALN
ncbi:Hpt domain-containing protein [Hoeflea marina]|uniref:Hpt domain-containing protein n=1 Tax=Hoeflea marina TaxID=274592 RepID=A0A317PMH0_9HYPH|nr:Hpt domain-containing protein [Hoeflea marina]PWW01713.1 Hpt domain-containing protein [Hoeflea marina]